MCKVLSSSNFRTVSIPDHNGLYFLLRHNISKIQWKDNKSSLTIGPALEDSAFDVHMGHII